MSFRVLTDFLVQCYLDRHLYYRPVRHPQRQRLHAAPLHGPRTPPLDPDVLFHLHTRRRTNVPPASQLRLLRWSPLWSDDHGADLPLPVPQRLVPVTDLGRGEACLPLLHAAPPCALLLHHGKHLFLRRLSACLVRRAVRFLRALGLCPVGLGAA